MTEEELGELCERAEIARMTGGSPSISAMDILALCHSVREARRMAMQLAAERDSALTNLERIQSAVLGVQARIVELERLVSRGR